jgi:hypothetical protein
MILERSLTLPILQFYFKASDIMLDTILMHSERPICRLSTGMRYAMLLPILEELAREGRIRMIVEKHGDLVS